jgi:hypothetical protein
MQQLLLFVRLSLSQLSQLKRTNCCMYTLLPSDDGQMASPKHVEI